MKSLMRVGVLMGGWSAEREVSLRTGAAVAQALESLGHKAVRVDVTREWVRRARLNFDVAFLALHGRYGEDGTIQGFLELHGIPYTGSGVTASAVAIDKALTKRVAGPAGILTAPFQLLHRSDWENAGKPPCGMRSQWLGAGECFDTAFPRLAPPFVVKPNREGSTIGIHIIRDFEDTIPALEDAFSLDEHVLLEPFIEGREVTAAVLDGQPLPLIEILPKSGFYDYAAKYQSGGTTQYLCPAPIDESLAVAIQEYAARVHDLLGCRGVTRSDFRITPDEVPVFLEINTTPGMTATSLVPKAAAAAGLGFESLVEKILQPALEEKKNQSPRLLQAALN